MLDLWLAENRPEYRSVALGGFHQRAEDMIQAAYRELPFEVPTFHEPASTLRGCVYTGRVARWLQEFG